MILPTADWQAREGLGELLDALGARGGLTRYVGGAVRDTIAGLPVTDIDCATALLPQEAAARIRAAGFKAVPTGIAHGTVTAVLPGGTVEVTTLRRDVATDGRHAKVAFTDDWQADAARRDFTINALSADPLALAVHDYFGGVDDLAAGRVRFIGDPLVRIAEDHLRILRFFRFHARFGSGAPHGEGLAACAARANDLMALSRERIADELLKLLALADPAPTVALMLARGILAPVLPEIGEEGVARLTRLVARETASGIPPDALRRFAALLPEAPETALGVAARLKLSNERKRRLALAADRAGWRGGSALQRAHGIGAAAAADRLLLGDEPVEQVANLAAALRATAPPRLPLKGGDLIALGLKPGPQVAATLQAIEHAWVDADFPDARWVRAEAARRVAASAAPR